MKKTYLGFLIGGAILLGSCKKMDHDMKEVSINFPAAYVVNGGDASISIINMLTGDVAETLKLDSWKMDVRWPHHIYASPITNALAVAIPGSDLSAGHGGTMSTMKGMVLVIDAKKGTAIKEVQLPAMNHNATFSPDGTEIWTSQMLMQGKVLVYDATTYRLKNSISVGMDPAEVTFSADGTKAYVANGGSDNVSVIDPATKAILKTISVGDEPVAAWVGGDGNMYVDNEDGESVSVIDVATDVVSRTIDLGFMPGSVAHLKAKNELWVTDPDNGKVHYWVVDAGGEWKYQASFSAAAGSHAIAFTSDGQIAYVTNQAANSVSVINTATHRKIKDISVGLKPNGIVLKN